MTRFEDGPAEGQVLSLRRAPKYLRVVECRGAWDALDQMDDVPQPRETLYAYEVVGEPGMCHIRGAKISGFYALATYRFIAEQPDEAVMRDWVAWRRWCLARQKAAKAGEPL